LVATCINRKGLITDHQPISRRSECPGIVSINVFNASTAKGDLINDGELIIDLSNKAPVERISSGLEVKTKLRLVDVEQVVLLETRESICLFAIDVEFKLSWSFVGANWREGNQATHCCVGLADEYFPRILKKLSAYVGFVH